MNKLLELVANIIQQTKIEINFTLIEVGAVSLGGKEEPFYELLNYFPSTRIIGFEIDKEVCDKMNISAPNGVKYYPHALGRANETRKLYITNNPMCSSLYKPNEKLISLYQNFEMAYLKSETTIDTIKLDTFIDKYDIGEIDFIKIDVQGAELDIFKGAKKSLKNVLKIVSEVEFVPHYINQPLFGDVCKFLDEKGLMFNKFLGFAGRSLKPVIMNDDKNFASQHIWSDAVFIKNIEKFSDLNNEQLLKLSLLAATYDSVDLAFYCLNIFDTKNKTALAKKIFGH
jgi:FkbM family methyltransferase